MKFYPHHLFMLVIAFLLTMAAVKARSAEPDIDDLIGGQVAAAETTLATAPPQVEPQAEGEVGSQFPDRKPSRTPSPGSLFDPADIEFRLQRLEDRLTDVERTRPTEDRVRVIAEETFRKLSLTIRQPNGSQRVQQVQAGYTSNGFHLNPGEILTGYTDIYTGRYVNLQPQPIQTHRGQMMGYQGDGVAFRQQGQRAAVRLVQPVMMSGCAGGSCSTFR